MSEKELKEICARDERTLPELVRSLIERGGISLSVAKKYFDYKEE